MMDQKKEFLVWEREVEESLFFQEQADMSSKAKQNFQ
jgi:hypothetical protein